MNLWHILAVLFALIGVVPALTLGSPIRIERRAVPAIMIITSLVLWFLPTGIAVSMALVPVAAYISSKLGIEHAGHEPADMSPAVEKVKGAAQAARERARRPKPVAVTQFVTHAYPSPEDAADLAPAAAEDDLNADDDRDDPGAPGASAEDTQDTESGAPPTAEQLTERLAALTTDPRMPAGAQGRLMGQHAGRGGLRSQHGSGVPSYVPAL